MRSNHPAALVFILAVLSMMLAPFTAAAEGAATSEPNTNGFPGDPWQTYNGYRTYDEVNAELASIAQNYSSIAAMYDLGALYPWPNGTLKTTRDGYHVYALKISDNPQLNESDEPEVIFEGLHHAREWPTVEMCMYIINTLVENYTTNGTIASIVNGTEVWVVPIVNPDGFVYSQTVNEWWRKNRRDNGGGSYGVDPNRNYWYKWGYDNVGSSGNKWSNVYRGPAPFSEPCVQLVRDLADNRSFSAGISYHTYGGLMIYPWAYDTIHTPHLQLFREWGDKMAVYNGYTHGDTADNILYPCNGETTDWWYGNHSIIGFCFELGWSSDGFHPPSNRILPLCLENIEPALMLCSKVGDLYEIFDSGVQGFVRNSSGAAVPGALVSAPALGGDIQETLSEADGSYRLHLPPSRVRVKAMKDNHSTDARPGIMINKDQFTRLDLVIDDIVPPEIASVEAVVVEGGQVIDDDLNYTIGPAVEVRVTEAHGETGLGGWVKVRCTGRDYISPKLPVEYDGVSGMYVAEWETGDLMPHVDYRVEGRLHDDAMNMDADGSMPDGPDAVVELWDATPPEIVDVRAFSVEEGVITDADGILELGTDVRIGVYLALPEPGLKGTATVTSVEAGFGPAVMELAWEAGDQYYYCEFGTDSMEPGTDFQVESTLGDTWGNVDTDGLPATPDLTFPVLDTTPPQVVNVACREAWRDVEPHRGVEGNVSFEAGGFIELVVREGGSESDCLAQLTITSASTGYGLKLTPEWDDERQVYACVWDAVDAWVVQDYVVETTLEDRHGNKDSDGLCGDDLVIGLWDTGAPVILSVTSRAAGGDPEGPRDLFECGAGIRFDVVELHGESGLSGTLTVAGSQAPFDPVETIELAEEPSAPGTYTGVWKSRATVPGQYRAFAELTDAHGNSDSDDQCVFTLRDTTPPAQVYDLAAVEAGTGDRVGVEGGGKVVALTWTGLENGADTILYRFGPYGEGSDAWLPTSGELMDIGLHGLPGVDVTRYDDMVASDEGTWVYAVVARDMYDNVNWTVGPGNAVKFNISEPDGAAGDGGADEPGKNQTGEMDDGSDPPDDIEGPASTMGEDHGGEGGGDDMPWLIPAIIAAIVTTAVLMLLLARRRRKRRQEQEGEEDVHSGKGEVSPQAIVADGIPLPVPLVAEPVPPVALPLPPPPAAPVAPLAPPVEVDLLPPAQVDMTADP